MTNIFISYGHDQYSGIVDELYDRLTEKKDENGEQMFNVFKDTRGAINDAHSWDTDLEAAISKSDFIVFLMSEYSTRKESVCLDEIAYARNRGGIDIIPIRIENVSSPLLICRLQWINWLMRPENLDGIVENIISAVNDYSSVIHNTGRDIVCKQLFKADYFCEPGDIIGREDVINECIEFIKSDAPGPLVLTGIAGSGKSAIVSELSKNYEFVRSVHRCRFDIESTRTAHNALCNLAYFLSCNNKDYADAIAVKDLEKVDEWDLGELFDKLFVQPLAHEKERYAVIIDGIDEMEFSEAGRLIEQLRRETKEIPELSIIISMRNEDRLMGLCAGLPMIQLTEERNLKAAGKMLETELKARNIYSEKLKEKILTASDGNFLYISKLFEDADCHGTPIDDNTELPKSLFAQYYIALKRQFENLDFEGGYAPVLSVLCAVKKPVTVDELAALCGLNARQTNSLLISLRYLVKFEAEKVSIYHRSMKDFLTSERIVLDAKSGITGGNPFFIDVNEGSALIVENAKNLSFFKLKKIQYIRDCLFCHIFTQTDSEYADELYNDYDEDEILPWAASALTYLNSDELELFAETVDGMEYGIRFTKSTLYWLIRYRKMQTVREICECISVGKKFRPTALLCLGRCNILCDDTGEAVNCFRRIISITEGTRDRDDALSRGAAFGYYGDIERKKRNMADAEKLYLQALEVTKENAERNPDFACKRNLAASYTLLSRFEKTRDNTAEAKRYAELALEINEKNDIEQHSFKSARDLALTYSDIGQIALKNDDTAEAERLFIKSLEIRERNEEDYPSFVTKADLVNIYDSLGDIAVKKEKLADADRFFRLELKYAEGNAQEFPSNASRRCVSVAYIKMGDLARKKKLPEEAEQWYEKALVIDEVNANADPTYSNRRDYSISCERIADLAMQKKDTAKAEELYKRSFAISRINARDFPSAESRRGLSLACNRLASIEAGRGNLKKAAELYGNSYKICMENLEKSPSYTSRRDLSIVCERLAKIAERNRDTENMKKLFSYELMLTKENAEKCPSPEARRDLTVVYNNIARISANRGDLEEAEKMYFLSLEIFSENLRNSPSFENRRDIIGIYVRLANIKAQQGKNGEAVKLCDTAIKLAKQNYSERPCRNTAEDLKVLEDLADSLK